MSNACRVKIRFNYAAKIGQIRCDCILDKGAVFNDIASDIW